jgi:hypothetical protein
MSICPWVIGLPQVPVLWVTAASMQKGVSGEHPTDCWTSKIKKQLAWRQIRRKSSEYTLLLDIRRG